MKTTRRTKPDFGVLLTAFDGKSRPPLRGRKAIALPPFAELLEIDREAEQAATLARIPLDAAGAARVDSETEDN